MFIRDFQRVMLLAAFSIASMAWGEDYVGPFRRGERVLVGGGDAANGVEVLGILKDFYATRYPGRSIEFKTSAATNAVPDWEPTAVVEVSTNAPIDMVNALLLEQGVRREVSTVALDVRKLQLRTKNARTGRVARNGAGYEFTVTELSLPMVRKGFAEELNREYFYTRGLQKGLWELIIDEVAVWSGRAEDLESGVNLAALEKTPMQDAARKLLEGGAPFAAVERRWKLRRTEQTK